jgi:extracellular factor (EF) 3-hydroxypalmitic acid methyl ester biosynthesis protein
MRRALQLRGGHAVRTYEELTGGFGQAIAFRARRQLARELLRERASAVAIAGAEFQLYDMAMNGVSFLAPPDAPRWQVDDVLEVDIRVHDTSAYRGRARVAREERLYGQRRVGLQLLSGFLDLHEMQRLDEDQALSQDLIDGPERLLDRIPASYREALLAAVHFASFYKRTLGYHEARLRDADTVSVDEREALARRAVATIRPRWNGLRLAAARAALEVRGDRLTLAAAKAATETLLTPLLTAAPVLHRAYTKPLGYAGDFSVMLHIYKDGFEGDTAFGQVFHKLACEEPLSAGVRTRKDLVKQITAREHARRAAEGLPLRAMSLGCGPAREVVEFLSESPEPPASIHWTLIDQEEKALSVAYHDVLRAIDARQADCTAQCLYLSFEQLIRDPSALGGEPQDLVYCVGLFDYLNKRRGQALLSSLYERLLPGGLMAIGNAQGPNSHYWLAELVLDWTLIYRDRDELRQLAAPLLAVGAELEIQREASEAYDFMLIRKPR